MKNPSGIEVMLDRSGVLARGGRSAFCITAKSNPAKADIKLL
jgi:hypothetical protein